MEWLRENKNILEAPRILFLKDQKNLFQSMLKTLISQNPNEPWLLNLTEKLTINHRYKIIKTME